MSGQRLARIARSLWDLPPRDVVRRIQRRWDGVPNDFFDIEDVLRDPKLMRPTRLFDYLNRFEHMLRKFDPDWQPLSFNGKRVLEIGSGPTMGWAPLAVFLGCESYVCCEPYFQEQIRTDERFEHAYLRKVFLDLSALYGNLCGYGQFITRLHNRVAVERRPYLDMKSHGPYDLFLSNSVLEHVFPLQDTVVRMRREAAPDCRYIHSVDFTSHTTADWPFAGIYDRSLREAREASRGSLNLLRPTDIHKIFLEAGFADRWTPVVCNDQNDVAAGIHDDWASAYAQEVLNVMTGLFSGEAGSCTSYS